MTVDVPPPIVTPVVSDTETLRDRFAMAFLTGIISSGKINGRDLNAAAMAYKMADAMISERQK